MSNVYEESNPLSPAEMADLQKAVEEDARTISAWRKQFRRDRAKTVAMAALFFPLAILFSPILALWFWWQTTSEEWTGDAARFQAGLWLTERKARERLEARRS